MRLRLLSGVVPDEIYCEVGRSQRARRSLSIVTAPVITTSARSVGRLRVLAFPCDDRLAPNECGQIVFESTAPLREIADAIATGAQAVLDEYGGDEYLRRWVEHPFPVGHLQLIEAHFAAE